MCERKYIKPQIFIMKHCEKWPEKKSQIKFLILDTQTKIKIET